MDARLLLGLLGSFLLLSWSTRSLDEPEQRCLLFRKTQDDPSSEPLQPLLVRSTSPEDVSYLTQHQSPAYDFTVRVVALRASDLSIYANCQPLTLISKLDA